VIKERKKERQREKERELERERDNKMKGQIDTSITLFSTESAVLSKIYKILLVD